MEKFKIGSYVRYLNKVWIVDSLYEDMMFIRSVDDDSLEVVFENEYSYVEAY